MRKGLTYSEAGKLGAQKSKATQNKLKQERVNKYEQNPTQCKHCDKVLDYNHRHCQFCNIRAD
jgi:hypothetical protein